VQRKESSHDDVCRLECRFQAKWMGQTRVFGGQL
jgi:hypothetical protein